MFRRLSMLLLPLLMAAVLLAGCGGTASQPSQPAAETQTQAVAPAPAPAPAKAEPEPKVTKYPLTITDDAGRQVTIAAEPKRIVSVAPSNSELVFALGKGASLVGRSDFCDYPADVKSVPSIGGFHPPDYEKIVAARPDLLLMVGGSVEAREKLTKEHKINVYVMDPKSFRDLYASIRDLGTVLNAQEQADKVVADMQKAVQEVMAKTVALKTKPKVFYEVWDNPLMTAGNNTFINDLILLAGGVNAGGDVEGWAMYSAERLQKGNPDVIVAGSKGQVDKIKVRKGWEGMKAVKEAKVFSPADNNLLVRPGPRLVQGLQWMAQTLHPDAFKQ